MGPIQAVKNIPKFLRAVRQELKKVSWSTREELIGATWTVIATTMILTIYVGSIDFALSKFLTTVLK